MISKIKIFISREISDNSPLNELNDFPNIELLGESLISIKAIDFKVNKAYDWIFFYSQNAVLYFLKGLTSPIPSDIKIGCIGNKTAQLVQSKIGRDANFIIQGAIDLSVQHFLNVIGKAKVLFPRASISQQSVQKYIPPDQVIDLIVYDNNAKENIDIPFCDILVFTSPLNFSTYNSHYTIGENQLIIAIGNTTAASISKLVDYPILIAKEPSEESIKELIEKHLLL